MDNKKLAICLQYIGIVSKMFAGGVGSVDSYDEERIRIHEELLEIFDFDKLHIETICSRLDIWLGFPTTDKEFSPANVAKYGQRLYDLLTSDWVKENGWSKQNKEYKRLRTLWFDDDNFDGWKPS